MPAFLVHALVALGPSLSAPVAAPSPVLVPNSPVAAPRAAADEGDEESAFIAGIAKRGMHDIVIREADKFLERRPRHRRATVVRYRKADALFELGRVADALKEYAVLDRVTGFEQAAEVKFRVGQCSLDLGENADAAEAFVAVRKTEAAYLHAPASYLLGEALFRDERFPEARAAYASVLDTEAEGAQEYARDARYGVTWSAWKSGDRPGTVDAARAFVQRHGEDPLAGEIAFLAGEALLEGSDPAGALEWYDRVREGDYVEGALRGAAFAVTAQGDHVQAAQRFRAYLDRFPQGRFAAEAALQLGVQLVRAARFEDAVTALTKSGVPDDAVTCYWRATALAGSGRHEDAYASARAGLAKSPDDTITAQLRIVAGDALFELGRPDEAAAFYEQSGDAYAVHAAAIARLNVGDAAEAERLARSLLSGAAGEAGAPYRAEALTTYAEALFRLERYEDAEGPLRTLLTEARPRGDGAPPATKVDPSGIARAVSRLAWCRWYADDFAAAGTLFESVASDGAAGDAERNEARFMSGRCALAGGDDSSARQAFRGYLESAARGQYAAEALLRLARLSPEVEGAEYYEALIAGYGDSELVVSALGELAELRLAAQNFEAAAAAYAALVARFPDDPLAPGARYGLGWVRYQAQDFSGAAEPLWHVARDTTSSAELRLASLELLVWIERDAERPQMAVAAFRAFVSRVDDEARVLAAARVVDDALEAASDSEGRGSLWGDLAEVLQQPASICAARVEQGFLLLDAGKPDEARLLMEAARRASSESPGAAELAFFTGEAYFEAGDDETAATLFAVASAHGKPEVAERALYKGGFAELRRGRSAEAMAAFVALVERYPGSALAPESMFLAGEASYRAGDDASATKWLRRMVKEAPKHASLPKALFRLGLAEGRQQNWRACSEALAELIAKTPEFTSLAEAELWRGRAMSRLGERRAARQSLGRVVSADDGVLAAQARIELGRLFEAEKDDEGAVSEYLKVAVLYGHAEECAEALVRAGDVLARSGKADRAKEQYREAVAEYPKAAWAAEARERLRR